MNANPQLLAETDRLAVLNQYDILDSLPEQEYDDITRLAAEICQMPVALITLVDKDRQWFKSRQGFPLVQTPIQQSFCAHAITQSAQTMVVADARQDARFADNLLVTGEYNIVFYAGAPIVTKEGVALGSLCVIDNEPRQLSPSQLQALEALARQVMTLLELRKANRDLTVREARIQAEIHLQQQTQQALTASEISFRSLIDEAPVATSLYVGRELRIELANWPMLAYWGKNPSVIGKPLAVALPELTGQPFLAILDDVFTTGKTYEARNAPAHLIVNGEPITSYFDYTFKPLRNPAGEVYAIMNMATDVTEQLRDRQALAASESRYRLLATELEQRVSERTQELTHVNQDLLRSNENLQQFAYVASHDLQEPLRKIQSFSTLLAERFGDTLGDEGRDYLTRMCSAGARMSNLIRDLLAFSRIATRQQAFEPVSLETIVADVLRTLELTIAERDAQLTITELPIISGDESQLSQLLQNLLSNALKFTPAGQRPVISVQTRYCKRNDLPAHMRPTSTATQFCQLTVIDQGIGFDEKYTDRIFQVFQRLHGKQQYAGTGVGLAICQRVADNHGGCITAHSQPGHGATFSVYLPVPN